MSLFESVYDEMQLKMRIDQILANQIAIMGVLYDSRLCEGTTETVISESVKQTMKLLGIEMNENENS